MAEDVQANRAEALVYIAITGLYIGVDEIHTAVLFSMILHYFYNSFDDDIVVLRYS